MSFKEVLDLDCDTTIALGGVNKQTKKKNPTQVEGYYIGSKDTISKKSKNGIAKLHILQTEEGRIGVWGKTNLDQKMGGVKPGTMIRVTQNGMIPTPNGDMYKFKVEVDETNTIEVNLPDQAVAAESDSDDSSYTDSYSSNDDEESDLDEDDNSNDEVSPPPASFPKKAAAAPTAAQQAKVKALLSGKVKNV